MGGNGMDAVFPFPNLHVVIADGGGEAAHAIAVRRAPCGQFRSGHTHPFHVYSMRDAYKTVKGHPARQAGPAAGREDLMHTLRPGDDPPNDPPDVPRTRGGQPLRPTESYAQMLDRWRTEAAEAEAWKLGRDVYGKAERAEVEPEPPAEQGRLEL